MIVHQIAIINAVVSKLGSHIADLDAWKNLVRADISDRHNERLNPIVCIKSDASGKDDCMGSLDSKIAWPEFCGLECWGVNDELICLQIQSCRRFKASDVRAMAKLCLGVASNDLPAVDQGPIVTRLLFAAKLQNSLGEHLHVQCHWTSPRETEVPRVVLAFLV